MGRRKVLHSYLILFTPSIDSKQEKRRQRGWRKLLRERTLSVQIAALPTRSRKPDATF
jgi:hypothetical protein